MSMKKTVDKKIKRETSKDDSVTAKKPEEKLKKSVYSFSTPRNFIQKSSAADIYAGKGNVQSVKAPKKSSAPIKASNNASPMKDLLKPSPSNVSLISTKSHKLNKSVSDSQTPSSARYTEKSSRNMGVAKKLPFTNVTVNSPIAKKKLNAHNEQVITKEMKRIDEIPKTKSNIFNRDDVKAKEKERKEKERIKEPTKEAIKRKEIIDTKVVLPERRRTKTRTLEEEEIKILTPDVVDNNLEMLNINKKLSAQPKAFYVGLNEENPKPKTISDEKSRESDAEVSYEDDFDSYESDFDSYQSDDISGPDIDRDCQRNDDDHDCRSDDHNDSNDSNLQENDEVHLKEEKMLDSGNFELRDARSVCKSKPLNYILEDSQEEGDKKISLTDEGFQEMSSSSGLSSMKTQHIDILDRPLFIDFTKSKENRRKRKIFERLKQRADDILSMVTLHEMSYDLYEMKPIPYDLYMATFGRFNYTQTAVQTFDDGMNEEVQTDEILVNDKWTQYPIEFSYHYFNQENNIKKKGSVENFAFLIDNVQDDTNSVIDDNYKINPLRIYLEQKDGVGTHKILPYENYKSKLKNDEYDVKKLRKFLKKFESRISNVLSNNSGNTMTNLSKTSKFPFSNEYFLITTRDIKDDKTSFLNNSHIMAAIFSDTKTNLIITVHNKSTSGFRKCVLCLWDLSVVILKPLKILIATDNVKIGRFKGSTDGFIVGALYDGTILLWDLTEEPTWCNDIAHEGNTSKMVETESKIITAKHSDYCDVQNFKQQHTLQACSYTSSGLSMCNNEQADSIVGLEFMGQHTTLDHDRKILAQLCALQSVGTLTIWSVIQERTKNLKHDIGRSFWSRVRLERNQTINLLQHIDWPIDSDMTDVTFNLNSVKKRMSKKRNERNRGKIFRPKSAVLNVNAKCQDDSSNVASRRTRDSSWESGVVCNHLKIMNLNGVENYLVAKNGGEVLCCRRDVGSVKVKPMCVTNAASSVTCIEASPHGMPYFLAATDCGTVNMCSLLDYRVLLTLDCRNGPSTLTEKCQSDHKGRFLGTVTSEPNNAVDIHTKQPISSVTWLHPNPFCIVATLETSVVVWELTQSDIRAKCRSDGVACTANQRSLALLTKEGDVQVFRLTASRQDCLELFQKYVALL